MIKTRFLLVVLSLVIFGEVNAQVEDFAPFEMPTNIQLQSRKGDDVTSADFLNINKPLVIIVNWYSCKPSRSFLRALDDIQVEWQSKYDAVLVVIEVGKQTYPADFITNTKDVYYDRKKDFADNFLSHHFDKPHDHPRLILVDKNNMVVYSRLGYLEKERETIMEEISAELSKIQ